MSSLKEPHEQDAARMLSFLHGDDAHTFQTVPEGDKDKAPKFCMGI